MDSRRVARIFFGGGWHHLDFGRGTLLKRPFSLSMPWHKNSGRGARHVPGVLPPGYAPDGHDGHNLPGQIPQNKKQAYKRCLISLHLSSPPSLFGMAQLEHNYAFLSNYTTILFAIIVRYAYFLISSNTLYFIWILQMNQLSLLHPSHARLDFLCLPGTYRVDSANLHPKLWNLHCSRNKARIPVFEHEPLRNRSQTNEDDPFGLYE